MRITLNGEEFESEAATVAALLQAVQTPVVGVAVAVNGRVVRKAEHADTPLHEGDEVEMIRAVQGG